MYLSPTSSDMSDYPSWWGVIATAGRWTQPLGVTGGRWWAMDNEAFTRKFNPELFFTYLERARPYSDRCLFVTVPDVVGNALATQARYRWWAWRIKAHGWPVAFVAQDGQELLPFPPEFDALFIGGTTEWKMSMAADECIRRAKALGKWVHVGRVNSQTRIKHFQLVGADSCDGTTFIYSPDIAFRCLNKALAQRPLFNLSELSVNPLPDFTDWVAERYPDLDPEDDATYWQARQEYVETYGEENL